MLHEATAPLGVSAIARASGFAPSRVHHYLVSLVKTGLVRKVGKPGGYVLGPFAIRLGLTAVDRLDVQHICAPYLREISNETGEASFFSIWSPTGPVIVRWEQGLRPLTVYARLGTVMPLLRSATGEVYCTWGADAEVNPAVDKALLQYAPASRSEERERLRKRVRDVRQQGVGTTCGAMLPDVSAVAAPVFDRSGAFIGALTVLGLLQVFDALPQGPNARAVLAASRRFSSKLGHEYAET